MLPDKPIDQELADFFRKGRLQKFQKGEIIMRAGDTPQGVYFIESGHVKVYSLSKEADEHTNMFYVPGNTFPLMFAFQNVVRNVFYEALEDATLWLVPKEAFLEFAGSNVQVTMHLLEQTVDMFRIYAGRIDNLLYSNSHEKVAYRLLAIIDQMGERREDGSWIVDVPITHQDIADSVSLSRETVSRCMERLRRKDIVGANVNRLLVINDLPALARIVGEDEVVGMWPQLSSYIK